MAITLKNVRALLEPEEPDYIEAAKIGPKALPQLAKLIKSEDPGIAAKAASLAGFIDHPDSVRVLENAAMSEDPILRVAAAGAARHLSSESASAVLVSLVEDEDAGVQKTALKSVPLDPSPELQTMVARLALQPDLPAISREALFSIEGPAAIAEEAEVEEHVPEIGPMPGYDGPLAQYDEQLSSDGMPGFEEVLDEFSPALAPELEGEAVEQEMPGSAPAPARVSAVEQEMPGFDDAPAEGAVEDDDQAMPDFEGTSEQANFGSEDQEMPGAG